MVTGSARSRIYRSKRKDKISVATIFSLIYQTLVHVETSRLLSSSLYGYTIVFGCRQRDGSFLCRIWQIHLQLIIRIHIWQKLDILITIQGDIRKGDGLQIDGMIRGIGNGELYLGHHTDNLQIDDLLIINHIHCLLITHRITVLKVRRHQLMEELTVAIHLISLFIKISWQLLPNRCAGIQPNLFRLDIGKGIEGCLALIQLHKDLVFLYLSNTQRFQIGSDNLLNLSILYHHHKPAFHHFSRHSFGIRLPSRPGQRRPGRLRSLGR